MKAEQAPAEMREAFESRCVWDKCFDQPLASFIGKKKFTYYILAQVMCKRKSGEESS